MLGNSCEAASSWSEVLNASHAEPDASCHKAVRSSLRWDQVEGQQVKFCLTNSVDTWCRTKFSVPPWPLPLASRGSADDDGTLRILKVSSAVLVVALTVLIVVFAYFVKKKVNLGTQCKKRTTTPTQDANPLCVSPNRDPSTSRSFR